MASRIPPVLSQILTRMRSIAPCLMMRQRWSPYARPRTAVWPFSIRAARDYRLSSCRRAHWKPYRNSLWSGSRQDCPWRDGWSLTSVTIRTSTTSSCSMIGYIRSITPLRPRGAAAVAVCARIPQGIERLVLSVTGPLVALPLHALRVLPGVELRFGDVYEINYVPSFAAWQHCISHAAAPAETAANGAVIQDDSLLFSRFECQAIAGSLASPPTLITASSDIKEQVVTALSTRSFVQLLVSCFLSRAAL